MQACNNSGLWNEDGASIAITVLPFWWQTWWFWTGSGLAFTLSVASVARHFSLQRVQATLESMRRQRVVDQERGRIARDLHDDLGTRLTHIALLSDLAQRDILRPDEAKSRVLQIAANSRQLIKSLSYTIWAISPGSDSLRDLIDHICCFSAEFLQAAGIRCRLALLEDCPEHELQSDVRHNVFLVIKEALNNIARHANASEVTLDMAIDGPRLLITIADNGRGFTGPSDGHGLANMRQRMNDIGGDFHIERPPAGGTQVTLEFRWKDNS